MKFKETMKKMLAAIMATVILCGGINVFGGNTTAKASENPVQMYSMDHYFSKYGIYQYTVYIQIDANSANNKAVYVHHSTSDGWVDTEATFLIKLDDNTEIWKADISGVETDKYVIKYVGDGTTYWDNNNGNNYNLNNVAGSANVKAIRRNPYVSSTCIRAVVKNLAYNKIVKVRYTRDNWLTYNDVDLLYVSSISETNEELWSVDIGLDTNNSGPLQYCIYYEVNGQTYWDNNFGSNYDSTYTRLY